MTRLKLGAALIAAIVITPSAFAADAVWTGKVRKLIASKQTYPLPAEDRGEQGTATIKLNVAADGKLQSVELLQTSGSRTLDREAVTLPNKVGTFPAPGADTTLTLPLTWKLG